MARACILNPMKRFLVPLLVLSLTPLWAQRRPEAPVKELEKRGLLERLSQTSERAWQMEWDRSAAAVRQLHSGLFRAGNEPRQEAAARFLAAQSALLDIPAATE